MAVDLADAKREQEEELYALQSIYEDEITMQPQVRKAWGRSRAKLARGCCFVRAHVAWTVQWLHGGASHANIRIGACTPGCAHAFMCDAQHTFAW